MIKELNNNLIDEEATKSENIKAEALISIEQKIIRIQKFSYANL